MINYNKFNINLLSTLISAIIFIFIILVIKINQNEYTVNNYLDNSSNDIIETTQNIDEKDIKNWTLKIESLKMQANIKQMEKDIPDENSIGHFKETNILGNNIAIIAYNYGKKNNYFSNIKDLKIGEKIIYTVNEETRIYQVISNKIIEKNSLNSIIKIKNQYESYLKLFTYIKDLNSKLRYICAKQVIDI